MRVGGGALGRSPGRGSPGPSWRAGPRCSSHALGSQGHQLGDCSANSVNGLNVDSGGPRGGGWMGMPHRIRKVWGVFFIQGLLDNTTETGDGLLDFTGAVAVSNVRQLFPRDEVHVRPDSDLIPQSLGVRLGVVGREGDEAGEGSARGNSIELCILGTTTKALLDMAVRLFLQAVYTRAVVRLLSCPEARESST